MTNLDASRGKASRRPSNILGLSRLLHEDSLPDNPLRLSGVVCIGRPPQHRHRSSRDNRIKPDACAYRVLMQRNASAQRTGLWPWSVPAAGYTDEPCLRGKEYNLAASCRGTDALSEKDLAFKCTQKGGQGLLPQRKARGFFICMPALLTKDHPSPKPVYNGIHQHGESPQKSRGMSQRGYNGRAPNFPARMFQFLFPSPNQDHGGIGTGRDWAMEKPRPVAPPG